MSRVGPVVEGGVLTARGPWRRRAGADKILMIGRFRSARPPPPRTRARGVPAGRFEDMRGRLGRWTWLWAACLAANLEPSPAPAAPPGAGVSREEVEQAIRGGVNFLLKIQRPNGTWGNEVGESALVTLAL